MNAWADAASVILVQLALISPNASGTGHCGTATDAYQAAVTKVTNALHACLDANLKLVTSGMEAKVVLTQLIVRIAGAAAKPSVR